MMNEKKTHNRYFRGIVLGLIKIWALFIYLYPSRPFMQVSRNEEFTHFCVSSDPGSLSKQTWMPST